MAFYAKSNQPYSETVTWLELAIDFQASTHVELGRPCGPCTELTAGKRAIFFASASRKLAAKILWRLWPLSRTTWLEAWQHWGCLLLVVFLCVQNSCFLKWFMRFLFRRHTSTWRTLHDWTSSHSLVLWASLCGIQISYLWRNPDDELEASNVPLLSLQRSHHVQWLRELVMTSPGILDYLITFPTLPQRKSGEKETVCCATLMLMPVFGIELLHFMARMAKVICFSFVKSVIYRLRGKLGVANGQKIDVVALVKIRVRHPRKSWMLILSIGGSEGWMPTMNLLMLTLYIWLHNQIGMTHGSVASVQLVVSTFLGANLVHCSQCHVWRRQGSFVYTSGCQPVHGGGSLSSKTQDSRAIRAHATWCSYIASATSSNVLMFAPALSR